MRIEMLVVRLTGATAAAGGFTGKRICGLVGRRWFMKAQFLFFVVCFVADARTPCLIGVQATASATAAADTARISVARVFIAAASRVPVVAVFKLAHLGINPAFDACRSGTRVV
jgi:hypothetical protein